MPAANAASKAPPLYFVNALVDHALIGGVSIVVFVLLRRFHSGMRTETVWVTGVALAWIVNWPHFSATSYRLYHSGANIRQYPITALVVPFLVGIATVGSFASPGGVAPWLVKVFMIWSPYHFSGQSLGITLVYGRRAGLTVGRWERLAFSGFIFSTFLYLTASSEAGWADTQFFEVSVPTLGLPGWVALVMAGWMGICAVAVLFFAVRWSVRQRRILPPIVLLPAAAQFVWFVLGSRLPSFYEFVPLFHALQYLLVAWVVQLKEKLDSRALAPSQRFVVWESARWVVLNVAGGALLFWALPRLGASAGFSLGFATAVVFAGVQIHHFFVDGVIWKLKNPRVSSPLLVNIGELAAAPVREAAPEPVGLQVA